MQALGEVALQGGRVQQRSAQSDVAVGAQEIEGGVGDLGAGQLRGVARIGGDGVDAAETAEGGQVWRRGLADQEQIELVAGELPE